MKWLRDIPSLKNKISRSVALNKKSITAVDLHAFGDVSIVASRAVVYAVVNQPSVTNQGLVVSKSCISEKNLTIPILELVSAHIASNLIENVKAAVKHCNIRSVTGWTDSTVVLHWLNRQGIYKQLAVNRVINILERGYIKWYYVPTKQNPGDIGSRGSLLSKISDIWRKCPSWRVEIRNGQILSESKEFEKKSKIIKNILATTVKQKDLFDFLLAKYELHKVLKVSPWITRSIKIVKELRKQSLEQLQKYNVKRSSILNVNTVRNLKRFCSFFRCL